MNRYSDAIPPGIIALATVGTLMTSLAIYGFLTFAESDFLARYKEGIAWRHGSALYERVPSVNMHPPTVTMIVFAPLSNLPYRQAQTVWLLANLIGLAASIRLIARTLSLPPRGAVAVTALLLLSHGMYQQWILGQFTALLLYPATRAWVFYREDRHALSAAWLAVLIAVKPQFALLAVLLHWRTWIIAGVLSATMSLIVMAFSGVTPWMQWLEAASAANWLTHPYNSSLWGMAARLQVGSYTPLRMTDLTWYLSTIVVVCGGGLAWHALRQSDGDRRFFCAGLWSVLISPLGWIYYLPLVTGAAAASWPHSALAVLALTLLSLPLGEHTASIGLLRSSMYFAGVLCAWFAWSRSSQRRIPA